MTWSDISHLPAPPAGKRIPYGSRTEQWGELRLPEGKGPFPVIILIHGGCWLSNFDVTYISHLAQWFTFQGVATWTIEYRRLGNDGGGWPGTFLDVARAADSLRDIAQSHPLDINRVYAGGHSAGGQLALWLASRGKLKKGHDLYLEDPIQIRGVLGLAAITDLAQYRVGAPGSCNASVDALLGGDPSTVPTRYAVTSPSQLLPLGVSQVFIHGRHDPIVDPDSVSVYVAAATKARDHAVILPLPDAGHFEPAIPRGANETALKAAWQLLLKASP